MTQQKDTIQSGNQILRAYTNEGIKTPASGLEEWVNVTKFFNETFNFAEFEATTIPYPVLVNRILIDVPAWTNSNGEDISISLNEFTVVNAVNLPSSIDDHILIIDPPHPLNVGDKITLDTTADIEFVKISIVGKRIAYNSQIII
jgi:hypothetical protein